jgi:hypothetical protein
MSLFINWMFVVFVVIHENYKNSNIDFKFHESQQNQDMRFINWDTFNESFFFAFKQQGKCQQTAAKCSAQFASAWAHTWPERILRSKSSN